MWVQLFLSAEALNGSLTRPFSRVVNLVSPELGFVISSLAETITEPRADAMYWCTAVKGQALVNVECSDCSFCECRKLRLMGAITMLTFPSQVDISVSPTTNLPLAALQLFQLLLPVSNFWLDIFSFIHWSQPTWRDSLPVDEESRF